MQFAALLAILPVILLLIYIYKMDSYEKEPIGLLVKLVIFGVISALPAILLEQVGTTILDGIFGKQNPAVAPSCHAKDGCGAACFRPERRLC